MELVGRLGQPVGRGGDIPAELPHLAPQPEREDAQDDETGDSQRDREQDPPHAGQPKPDAAGGGTGSAVSGGGGPGGEHVVAAELEHEVEQVVVGE